MNVFIVDDSAPVRQVLRSLLEDMDGVQVIGQAECPLEAIDGIHRVKPDVVVLDLQLKNGSGIDVLVDIKKRLPAVIVIMFTAFPHAHIQTQCRQAGADFFFDKSKDVNALMDAIKTLAGESKDKSR